MLNNLDKSTILKNLKTDIDLIVLETVASTNTYLQDLKPQVITACLAEKQTSGRGQFERNWQSPSGNIYLSLAYPFTKAKNLTGLSLVAGLAVCDAVEQCCQLNQHLQVKWPNDIIADTKKLAGILIETQPDAEKNIAIIGIGLNVTPVASTWTSLSELCSNKVERNMLVANIINCLLASIQLYKKTALNDFIAAWNKRDYLFDKKIQIQSGQKLYSGICRGIDEHGRIILRLDNSEHKAFTSASIL